MTNDRVVGGAIFGGSIVGVIVYGLLIFFWPLIVLEVSAFLAVLLLLGILAWIGYTMATTPPPEPITDFPEVKAEPPAAPTPDDKEK
jgi:predicted DNA-binding transcriptional regulator